jgi:serine protease Do
MLRLRVVFFTFLACALPCAAARADTPDASAPAEMSVAEITAKVRDSTVTISVLGREGERSSLGTGFVVGNGLIATCAHVIGEARPVFITTSDGKRFDVTEIYATDPALDLAVVRVKATDLKPLPLGDSDRLRQGQEVVAIGNPRGLEYSVVSGVVSAIRKIDGKPLIQLAIPIEQGNSGGPLLDRRGRVEGILSMKSVVTENLGFAIAVNALKPLLAKPNPLPIERWLTIGAIDPSEWTPLFGAHWRQRAGRLIVEGPGTGFGGRALLISREREPAAPYELAVWVKLYREDGAAGLTFCLHDADRHYSFYPSAGRIRLTRFDGPDADSWTVLKEVSTTAYRPGEWNRLMIRFESGRIRGYVNDVLAVDVAEHQFSTGSVGLASFRDTHAEFKGFEVGKELPSVLPSKALVERVEHMAGEMKLDEAPDPKAVEQLARDGDNSVRALRQSADRREREAKQLRRVAEEVQLRHVLNQIAAIFKGHKDPQIDLLRASLLVARIENQDIDVDAYVREVDRMAATVRSSLGPNTNTQTRLKALDEYLFNKLGFHGSRTDFYNRSNSFMNEVIDDREGLPITLSILYIELAKRLGVDLVGVGVHGRFMVRLASLPDDGPLIDVFEGARVFSRQDVEAVSKNFNVRAPSSDEWHAQSKRDILERLVQNLMNVAAESEDAERVLRYDDVLLVLDPASVFNHWQRALACYKAGRRAEALAEIKWLLAKDPQHISDVVDPSQVQQLQGLLEGRP